MTDVKKDFDAGQVAQQAAQAAEQAAQQARQSAQEIAQSVQDVKGAAQAVQEASRGVGAETSGATIETDISPISIGDAWRANVKRTYDAYQLEDLESIRLARKTAEQLAQAHTDHVRDLQAQINRAHANSISYDNELQKQHLSHRDLSTDRIWNVDEVSQLTAKTPVYLDALAASIAAAVADAMKDDK
jgi:hypothetical protein